MSDDQAASDPSCHFDWEGFTPFALKTADGRFVQYGMSPAGGLTIFLACGIYAYDSDAYGTRFEFIEHDRTDYWMDVSFACQKPSDVGTCGSGVPGDFYLVYPPKGGQLDIALDAGNAIFTASKVPA
ncbi:UNVERIFIED_ORG: hypothetical protein ABIC54_006691 [Burkholderia sp. 1263]|uniref:hypothetical protein n=1 Tax=Paraburkholderia terricola TaxID=169427 RepID=UPI00285912AA|nr:hypothetical protein [Paraburkholderia terricola]MDR6450428.1 hypothetical protein [Paraburkholderia terricola]